MLHCAWNQAPQAEAHNFNQENPMLVEKKHLTAEVMRSQTALQLPPLQMLALINVFITNVANNLRIRIPVQNNRVAVQVCAAVSALNSILVSPDRLTCMIR